MSVDGFATGAADSFGAALGSAAFGDRAMAAAEAGGEADSDSDGTVPEDEAARALGVVCGDVSSVGCAILGGGGGIECSACCRVATDGFGVSSKSPLLPSTVISGVNEASAGGICSV